MRFASPRRRRWPDTALNLGRTAAPAGFGSASACASFAWPPASPRATSRASASRRSTSPRSSAARQATRESIEWLAVRLGVDPGFLANGVATDERGRLEGALARAEALLESLSNDDAATEYETLLPAARATGVPELTVRALVGAGRTQMRLGALRAGLELLNEARDIVEAGSFSDLERAEVYTALGICRYQLNSIQTSLGAAQRGARTRRALGPPVRPARSNILSWRSRCWRRQRDYEAAREDIERALQLAEDANDPRTIGSRTSRRRSSPTAQGTGCSRGAYAEKAVPRTRSSPTASMSASSRTTSAG